MGVAATKDPDQWKAERDHQALDWRQDIARLKRWISEMADDHHVPEAQIIAALIHQEAQGVNGDWEAKAKLWFAQGVDNGIRAQELLDALKAANHTLQVHGKIDAGTLVDWAIRDAIAKAEATPAAEAGERDIRPVIEKVLSSHRLQYMCVADDESEHYPLVDLLSSGATIETGKEEIELLADAIAAALLRSPAPGVGEEIESLNLCSVPGDSYRLSVSVVLKNGKSVEVIREYHAPPESTIDHYVSWAHVLSRLTTEQRGNGV